jgi:hypothetical protein
VRGGTVTGERVTTPQGGFKPTRLGLFGSPLRSLIPQRRRQRLYDRRLSRERATPLPGGEEIDRDDFRLEEGPLDEALDLVAIGRAAGAG